MESISKDMQIFQAIATEVKDAEFMKNQYDFYAMHKDTFEDTEENKLEY